jgi:MarR family transcriptional regulator, 2-MHQ and catechol-resistance regulon repressor
MSAPLRLRSARPTVKRARLESRLEADTVAVNAALSDLVRVYQFRDRDRICCHDISVTQCYALEALIRRGRSTLSEVAAELYLDKSTASRVIATLERKRYVSRTSHPDDGRSVMLEVTAAGQRLYDRIKRSLLDEEKELLRDFEPEVRAAAAEIMARLARVAASRSGLTPKACCAS